MSSELRHVMLVDDDPAIQTIAKLSLEMVGGLSVSIANSGTEALPMAREKPPQLILLDVMMPGMDGPQILAEIQRDPALKSIPVIFMTAKEQKHELVQLERLGAVDVIPKPFAPIKLADQVKAIWKTVTPQ